MWCESDPLLHRIDVTTLGDLLLKAYDQFPDHAALIFPESSWTYRELVSRAMHTARGLVALGVKPNDHVGILMPTGPELVQMFFAVALCGATGVLINARYKSAEWLTNPNTAAAWTVAGVDGLQAGVRT